MLKNTKESYKSMTLFYPWRQHGLWRLYLLRTRSHIGDQHYFQNVLSSNVLKIKILSMVWDNYAKLAQGFSWKSMSSFLFKCENISTLENT